jgi:hypothetical protein
MSPPDLSGAAGAFCTRIVVKCAALLSRDLGKPRKASVGIVIIPADIRTGLPNTIWVGLFPWQIGLYV